MSISSNARFRQGLRRVHGEQAEQVFHNWYDGWRALEGMDWDMRPVLAQITCPALVVQGMQDEHATPQHARILPLPSLAQSCGCWKAPGTCCPRRTPPCSTADCCNFLRRGY